MRAIRLKVEKIIDAEVESLDIPAGADLTIRNHIMGNTALTYQKFINLIGKKAEKDSKYDIDKLYDLSKNYQQYWHDYLEKLSSDGYVRKKP